MDKHTMEIAVRTKVDLLYKQAVSHYNIQTSMPVPTVRFDLRGRAAGQAWFSRNLLRYNSYIMENNFSEFLSTTVPHEVAHIISDHVNHNDSPHGYTWKRVMQFFGCEPKRCHHFLTEPVARKVKRVVIYCPKCGQTYRITPKRWARISSPISFASCTVCHTKIDGNSPHELKILGVGR